MADVKQNQGKYRRITEYFESRDMYGLALVGVVSRRIWRSHEDMTPLCPRNGVLNTLGALWTSVLPITPQIHQRDMLLPRNYSSTSYGLHSLFTISF